MTRPLNSDPLRNFRFLVTISHPDLPTFARLGFMGCTGLAVATEAIPYREGSNNTTTRKMPGQTDFGPVGLTRGCLAAPTGGGGAGTNEAWFWFQNIFEVVDGAGTGPLGHDFRVPISIDVLEHPVTSGPGSPGVSSTAGGQGFVKVRFQLYNAWPMGVSWSDLDAGGNAIIVESMQIAHEGFDVYYPAGSNSPSDGAQIQQLSAINQ
jgi:phage tail-like protein